MAITAVVVEGSYAHLWCVERDIAYSVVSGTTNFDYSVTNGEICITGYNGDDEYLLIPEQILTLPVTGIGASAFANHSSLKAVTIRSNVVKIGAGAFPTTNSLVVYVNENSAAHSYCKDNGLNYVLNIDYEYTVSAGKATITHYTGSAKKVTVPSYIDGAPVNSIGWNAFADQAITSVFIPDTVTTIQGSALGNCLDLTSVALPDTLKSIETWAFSCCYALEQITIPASVTHIASDAFNCLTDIILNVEENSYARKWALEYNYAFSIVE